MRIQLSENFYLDEFTRSGIARRLGVDNDPGADEVLNLVRLTNLYLQPIRDHFGAVIILSGFRCPVVNAAVGSNDRSAHPWGMGVDFIVPGYTVRQVVEWIRDNLPAFDQVIDEFGEWVHLGSFRPVSLVARRQVLEAYKADSKTRYRKLWSAT